MRASILPLALSALLGALGALAALQLGAAPERPRIDPPAPVAGGGDAREAELLVALTERIGALEDSVLSERAAARPRAEPEARTGAAGDLADDATGGSDEAPALVRLEAKLDALAAALAEHDRGRSHESPAERLERARDERTETDWAALHALAALWAQDEAAAAREVRLSTDADVLRRYGPPQETWSNEAGTHWVYGEAVHPVHGVQGLEVYLRFVDRTCTTLGIARR